MSVIISETFDAGYAAYGAAWGVSATPNTLPKTGCVPGGYLLACGGNPSFSTNFPKQTFANTPTVALRCVYALQLASAIHQPEPFWFRIPSHDGLGNPASFIAGISFLSDGRVGVRNNSVGSVVYSAPGAFPTDGTPAGLQWGMALEETAPDTWQFNFQVAVEDTIVSADSIGLSPNVSGTIPNGYFNGIAIGAPTNLSVPFCSAFDNLEIDNSDAMGSYLACAEMLPVGQGAAPPAVVTGLSMNCDAQTFTITGTGFRDQYLTHIQVYGTLGQALNITLVSMTSTEIVVSTSDPMPDGQYCVAVFNDVLCFEYEP